jgi:hypothetical protein
MAADNESATIMMGLSVIAAPMLSVCQLTPLFYFTFLCMGLKRMFDTLRQQMTR